MLIAVFDFFASCSMLGVVETPSLLSKMTQDLFKLLISVAVLAYWGWMIYHCCQSKPGSGSGGSHDSRGPVDDGDGGG